MADPTTPPTQLRSNWGRYVWIILLVFGSVGVLFLVFGFFRARPFEKIYGWGGTIRQKVMPGGMAT